MSAEVSQLMMESQRNRLAERRTEKRQAFVRPVRLHRRNQEPIFAFSRDISTIGLGIVCSEPLDQGSVLTVQIHRTSGTPTCFRCEVRWCNPFGRGWYQAGLLFHCPDSVTTSPREVRPPGN